jgi:antitoxin MazE
MKTRIIKIGKSQGVRIPKALLEQSGLRGEVELGAANGQITIRARKPRAGWAKLLKQMNKEGHDQLLDEDAHRPTHWEKEEWEW